MNKYLKNLNRIEFVVTMACSGKCKHCSQGEHKSKESIDKFLAAEAVRKVAQEYEIESVMTFGGEPLLCPEVVFEIHKAAKQMNIPKRQLITNGYFSKDVETIKQVAKEIVECGINDVLVSADAFHQESIPLEYVMFFAEEVKAAGGRIRVHPAWLVSADDDNVYNVTTKSLLEKFNETGIPTSEGNVVFPAGKALVNLSEYFGADELNEKNPYWEDPKNIKAICFSANGDILGSNINENDIISILESYEPKG